MAATRATRRLWLFVACVEMVASEWRNPLKVLRRDWAALNMRSTARHIQLPRTQDGAQQCAQLKSEIDACVARGEFVVDAFARTAQSASVDETTRAEGGLLGRRLRQGEVACPVLDRACFVSPLGRVSKPIESDVGWHLVLVEERYGCRFDDGMVRVVARTTAAERAGSPGEMPIVRSVLVPETAADTDDASSAIAQAVVATIGVWLCANVGGQLLARTMANAAAGSTMAS